MSAMEIIAELSKLDRYELELVDSRVDALLQSKDQTNSPEKPIGKALLELAGTAKGLPPDYSANRDHWKALTDLAGSGEGLPPAFSSQHDHYLYGTPKRSTNHFE